MKPLSPLDSAACSELLDLCRIDAGRTSSPYKPNGSFINEPRNGGADRYWYYRGYTRTFDGSPGTATKTFVGRVGDEAVDALVAEHGQSKASYTARRQIVSRLKRLGLPSPRRTEAAVVQNLVETGLLAHGTTIVGSAAFQCYGALLGVRFDESYYRTQDLDLAQSRGLKIHLPETSTIDVLEVLRRADATFAPVFHVSEAKLVAGFRNAEQFRVEFLTSKTADRRGGSGFAEVAGLPGVGAQQLKFLEFLLKETTSAVMLHEAGLLVSVPDPARFAVHKMIVSFVRGETSAGNSGKSLKDILQAQSLIDGFAHLRDNVRLGRAWLDAWTFGPKWQKSLRGGSLRLDDKHLSMLAAAVTEAAVMDGSQCPFDQDANSRKALVTISRRSTGA